MLNARLVGSVFRYLYIFSSIEEELLKNRVIQQPRNFERRLFDIENSRDFRETYRLSVEAFEYLLAAVGQQNQKKLRAYGVIKTRFYYLQTGIRVRSMTKAAELVQCAVILHNICIQFNDDGADLLDNDDLHIEDDGEFREHGKAQESRRQQLLQNFL